MGNKLTIYVLRFVGLLLLQVFILNNIRLGSYVHPNVYMLFVLLLPLDVKKSNLILLAFLTGFIVDIFTATPGLHAASTVMMAFIRPSIISATTRRRELEGVHEPSLNEMGLAWFLPYSLILIAIHHFTLFMIEAFSFKLMAIVLLETLLSAAFSEILILIILYIFKPSKKRIHY